MAHRSHLHCRTCLRPGMRNHCVGAGAEMMRDRRRSTRVLDGVSGWRQREGETGRFLRLTARRLRTWDMFAECGGVPFGFKIVGKTIFFVRDFESCKLDLFGASRADRRSALPVAAFGDLVRARVLISALPVTLQITKSRVSLHCLENLSPRWPT